MSTLKIELDRTAHQLVEIAASQGVYFAVALLYDSNYDIERIRKLMPVLKKIEGSIK